MPTDVPSSAPSAFFSYCRADSALKLAEDLKTAGANVWIDQLDIEFGTPWDRAVEDALGNAPRMRSEGRSQTPRREPVASPLPEPPFHVLFPRAPRRQPRISNR